MSAVRRATAYRIEQDALIFMSIFRLNGREKIVPVRLRVGIRRTPLNLNTVRWYTVVSQVSSKETMGISKESPSIFDRCENRPRGEIRSLTRL